MGTPLRIDPEQRFSCAQCGNCCYRWDVVLSEAEIDLYRKRNVTALFSEPGADRDVSAEAQPAKVDPFEPVPGWPALQRIRKRADGGCGFLSPENRCRIHEELGADRKPLACRMYPYSFHPNPDAVVVTVSFGCPSIVANHGASLATGEALDDIEALRVEWFATRSTAAAPRELVAGRTIEPRSARVLRDSLLAMLTAEADIRIGIRRMAAALDDLTRSRVLSLSDDAFAEYVALTLPHAARNPSPPARRNASRIGRLLQYGFLYAVAAARLRFEQRGQSTMRLRVGSVRLLAHFHRLAPRLGRIDVSTLDRTAVDLNAPGIRPIVLHYLRSSLASLGGRERPLLDDLALAASYLNAAVALAMMNAAAEGRPIDRQGFSVALMEAVHLSHTDDQGILGGILRRLTGGTESLWLLQSTVSAD